MTVNESRKRPFTASLGLSVKNLDHIVLRVRDVDKSIRFYTEVLGLRPERLDEFEDNKVPFPSVRINDDTIIDLLPMKEMGSLGDSYHNQDHFCLVVQSTDMTRLGDTLKTKGVEVKEGPVTRWGAQGNATSIYITDPDDNVIELRQY